MLTGNPYLYTTNNTKSSSPMTDLNTTPNPHPPTLVFIPGGTFEMGDVMGDHEKDDELVHTVTLSDFHLASHLLTFAEYFAFCRAKGYQTWLRPDDHPLDKVRWYRAIEYCKWRSQSEGLQLVYRVRGRKVTFDQQANGYRLPTEAEWEYAAREAGRKCRFGNGKDIADPQEINFSARLEHQRPYSMVGNFPYAPIPVGSLNCPNALGLHDMSGNCHEWCWDWYADYPSTHQINPTGPTEGKKRVIRGGSWLNLPKHIRVANRSMFTPGSEGLTLGFRLARNA